jgi:hypothetical protein
MAESIKLCEVDKTTRKPRGKHSHLTDALGYVLWWLEPIPTQPATAPTTAGIVTVNLGGRG